jgi:hypothetical protein
MGQGQFRAKGTPAANGTYAYAAGAAPAVVAVPADAFLTGVSCWSTAAGATAQVGALNTVTLPPGGTLEQNVDGGIAGPVNVTFAGAIGGYLVEWVTYPS